MYNLDRALVSNTGSRKAGGGNALGASAAAALIQTPRALFGGHHPHHPHHNL